MLINTDTGNKSEHAQLEKLLKKWETLSKNLRSTELSAPILLPDLFLIADEGCEISDVLNRLTEFLSDKSNLMDFYGDVKYFQFLLNYCEPHSGFSEINRLMGEVKQAAGFRSKFKGIVHIDVREWLGHCEEKYFVELLNYLADNSNDWMIVISVRSNAAKKEEIRSMQTVLSMFLRTETLKLTLPKADHYLALLADKLAAYGITLTDDAAKLMQDTLKALCKNKYFGGAFTVNMLAQDIVYTLFSRPGAKETALDAAALKEFAPDSEYVQRTAEKLEMSKKIGFGN